MQINEREKINNNGRLNFQKWKIAKEVCFSLWRTLSFVGFYPPAKGILQRTIQTFLSFTTVYP